MLSAAEAAGAKDLLDYWDEDQWHGGQRDGALEFAAFEAGVDALSGNARGARASARAEELALAARESRRARPAALCEQGPTHREPRLPGTE